MGMNLSRMILLQQKGLLTSNRNRILDIGPQNVLFVSKETVRRFIDNQGAAMDQTTIDAEIDRIVYFSTPRPDERTTLLSEITDLTNIEYNSFDVCPGLKTEILDLNYDLLPKKHVGYYDVVLNFGTTEHIFNQWNCFQLMHQATKTDGVMFHQLPISGYLDHGYFCYTPLFFKELAAANDYKIEEMFITPAGENFVLDELTMDARPEDPIDVGHTLAMTRAEQRVPFFNMHAILRKTKASPFRVGLEIATAHSSVSDGVLGRYDSVNGAALDPYTSKIGALNEQIDDLNVRNDQLEAQLDRLRSSKSWRYTEPLRKIRSIL